MSPTSYQLLYPAIMKLAPKVGLEPTAYRLTAGCSTIELLRNTILCFRYLPDTDNVVNTTSFHTLCQRFFSENAAMGPGRRISSDFVESHHPRNPPGPGPKNSSGQCLPSLPAPELPVFLLIPTHHADLRMVLLGLCLFSCRQIQLFQLLHGFRVTR